MSAADTVEITATLHQDAGIALLVGKSADIDAAVWLRKQEIEAFEVCGGGQVFVVLPRALAAERGLA